VNAGSSATEASLSIDLFKKWLDFRYDKQYAYSIKLYILKYNDCYNNPALLSSLNMNDCKYNNVLKALIAYSKFQGCYEPFKNKLKNNGIHYKKQNALISFLRIMDTDNHKGLGEWYRKAYDILQPNEKLYLRYTLLSGLRREEAVLSFNLLVNKTEGYYNIDTSCLEHFKIKSNNGKHLFLRGTKNTFVSVIPQTLIEDISRSEEVSYFAMTKRLTKYNLHARFKQLRQFYATQMRTMGLLSEQVDVLQGRINSGVFLQYYFKQNPKTLSKKILRLLPTLENKLLKQQ
jgi:intergrase/recombinase